MKYGIDMGHNAPPDTGVTGIRQEDDLTIEVGQRVASRLRALGHQVVICTPKTAYSVTNSLWQRTNTANVNNVDFYVSIHFNGFNWRTFGTEIYAISQGGRTVAERVLNEIVKLGFFNRGVKDGSHLYVLRHTAMPSILVECCFADSKADMNLYNADKMADAIVKGLTGQTAPTPSPAPEVSQQVRELQTALNSLKIADDTGKALVVDGKMNAPTQAATKRLQRIVGLLDDGIAGDRTWLNLRQVLAEPILRPNHATGPAVRYIQWRLSVPMDGIYGQATLAAVKNYQSQNRMTVDGIVGEETWTKLVG